MKIIRRFLRSTLGAIKRGAAAGATTLAVASATFVGAWEGLETHAYRDVVGVLTICYGETAGVRAGDVKTKAECEALLAARLQGFADRLTACAPGVPKLPLYTQVALLSHAYNVGSGASCSSTLIRKVNAGDIAGACNELPRWNRAGGRVIGGLIRRRAAERILCFKGLAGEPFDWAEVMP